ncbi:isochorismatase family protein [Pseudonocardia hierapolitana]|uniref:Isochorismatase family protein n=1 Tax=Pseudonocardia hierapolitana TaxID=1128676 RepID=A0A561SZX3_9PSEU|nr:isochorismatase family protein [Pseudonocardia hierapolitana]TWF80416.1 isochorismatase family protein [Pseudonocardia hierapolitana]
MNAPVVDVGRTAVLVVDMQNDFVEVGAPLEFPEGRRMLPATQKVLDAARLRGMAVIYAAHVHRADAVGPGHPSDLYPPLAAGELP